MSLAYETGTGPFTLTAGADLEADRLVKISTRGSVVYCGNGEVPIGIARNAAASGQSVAVQPLTGGVVRITGAGAISAGAAIYCAANGKVGGSGTGKVIGYALTDITADGGKGAAVLTWTPLVAAG